MRGKDIIEGRTYEITQGVGKGAIGYAKDHVVTGFGHHYVTIEVDPRTGYRVRDDDIEPTDRSPVASS